MTISPGRYEATAPEFDAADRVSRGLADMFDGGEAGR